MKILLLAVALALASTAAWAAHQRCVPVCTNHSDGTQQCIYECYWDE